MAEEPKQEDRDVQGTEQKGKIDKILAAHTAFHEALGRLWDKRLGDKVKKFFGDNPTLVLTLLYLYVTAIGIIHSAILYGRFGINIFDYSEISDFLLVALKNPRVFLYVGGTIALSFIILAVITWKERRDLARHKPYVPPEFFRLLEEAGYGEEAGYSLIWEPEERTRRRTNALNTLQIILLFLFASIFYPTVPQAGWQTL